MPIIVHSPYSGLPVKVRDQDVNRAIRDEEGRIFYALPKSDGSGYYGSPTRQGSARQERQAEEMIAKMAQAKTSGQQQSQQQLHDATGKRRGDKRRLLVWLIILAAIIAGIWYFLFKTPQGAAILNRNPDASSRAPHTPPTQPVQSVANTLHPAHTAAPWISTASGLRYRVDEPGHGKTATAGKFVRIIYNLTIPAPGNTTNTTDVDSLHTPTTLTKNTDLSGQTVGFVLWSGQAIRGWDEGIAGMREGETRTLLLPPHLVSGGWAGRDDPQLPDATLQFQITLLEVLSGVEHKVIQPGHGRIARPGDAVEMNYVAYVEGSDKPCDDSAAHGQPLRCRIGDNQLIPGWELGVIGMAEGEKRMLTIPPYLAYGGRGAGSMIPPDATLRVEVELVRILPENTAAALLTQRPTLPKLGG